MYRLDANFDNFHNIDIDFDQIERVIDAALGQNTFYYAGRNNTQLAPHWADFGGTRNFTELNSHLPAPDITLWYNTYLVLNPNAFAKLESQLMPYGEFLPITIDAITHQLFNCHRIVEVDTAESEQEIIKGEYLGVKRIAFEQPTELSQLLCKTHFDQCTNLYCNDAFKSIVEQCNLGGLNFDVLNQRSVLITEIEF